ncbi:hypothetical protein H8356DRAFT_1324744 [Neocallimastix lanati (nom. inval.)]|nr:hypothetical protein H8356DRAFT_1324744 [Neocallimastix sp. JGI-2020a]
MIEEELGALNMPKTIKRNISSVFLEGVSGINNNYVSNVNRRNAAYIKMIYIIFQLMQMIHSSYFGFLSNDFWVLMIIELIIVLFTGVLDFSQPSSIKCSLSFVSEWILLLSPEFIWGDFHPPRTSITSPHSTSYTNSINYSLQDESTENESFDYISHGSRES